MRRQTLFIGFILCALLSGGWGRALAGSSCAHEEGAAFAGQAHECCHAHMAHAHDAQHSAAHQAEAMGSMPMTQTQTLTGFESSAQALVSSDETCNMCLSHSELPATVTTALRLNQAQPDTAAPLLQAAGRVAPTTPFATPSIVSNRGAPPILRSRHRYLLINVFLI